MVASVRVGSLTLDLRSCGASKAWQKLARRHLLPAGTLMLRSSLCRWASSKNWAPCSVLSFKQKPRRTQARLSGLYSGGQEGGKKNKPGGKWKNLGRGLQT